MSSFFPILIVIIFLAAVVIVLMLLSGKKKGDAAHARRKKPNKGRDAIFKEATRRLSQNPKDAEALLALGDIYYQDEAWDKAYKSYSLLAELSAINHDLDEFEINMRLGLSAIKSGKKEDAYKSLMIARTIKQSNFEVNYNLGVLEFNSRNFEKAAQILQQARSLDPEHPQTLRLLGHAYFRLRRYKEAMAMLRKAIDLLPDDKNTLYTIAECYFELNQTDQAVKIFTHLRADPELGPNAALFAGTINMNQHQYDKAVMDFEIGLKHQNLKPQTLVELKYRLALALIRTQEIGKALSHFRDVQSLQPGFKDVSALISKYQELNANKNLQIFLLSPTGDFVTLCRKIVFSYFPHAKIKILDITVNKNEWADIVAEVETRRWQDTVLFRFIRTQGQIGELILRDLYSRIKELKAGKGFCLTTGTFTDEARKFVEARLIDLVEKERLGKILDSVDTSARSLADS